MCAPKRFCNGLIPSLMLLYWLSELKQHYAMAIKSAHSTVSSSVSSFNVVTTLCQWSWVTHKPMDSNSAARSSAIVVESLVI